MARGYGRSREGGQGSEEEEGGGSEAEDEQGHSRRSHLAGAVYIGGGGAHVGVVSAVVWITGVVIECRDRSPRPAAVRRLCWGLPSGSARRGGEVASPSAAVCDDRVDGGWLMGAGRCCQLLRMPARQACASHGQGIGRSGLAGVVPESRGGLERKREGVSRGQAMLWKNLSEWMLGTKHAGTSADGTGVARRV